jgi:hypothetical protein
MSDLPVATVVRAAKALLAEVKAAKDVTAAEADAEEPTVEDAAVTPELYPVVEDVAASDPSASEDPVEAGRQP